MLDAFFRAREVEVSRISNADYVMDGTTLVEYTGADTCVQIPEGTVAVAPGAFRDRKQQLQEVVLPGTLREIMPHTFASCRRLRKVNMPAGLCAIGTGAFQDCDALTEIAIPPGVRRLRRNTFAGCRSLRAVCMPDGLQTLEDGVFSDCRALKGIRLPDSLRTIGSTAAGTLLERGVFAGSGLRELTVPSRVELIGNGAFSGCRELRTAALPEGLRQIGSQAFSDCRNLMRLRIPASVTAIGPAAFRGCCHPEQIALPQKLEKLRASIGMGYAGVYDGCTVENGVMTDCDPHLSEVAVPAGVTIIQAGAFNRLADELAIHPRSVAVRLPEALEAFERSRLGQTGRLQFVFPPRYLQQTHPLPMPFTRDLIAGGHLRVSLTDAASLFLFQVPELSHFAAQRLAVQPDQAARAMFAVLRQRRTPRALLRAAAFAEKHAAALHGEVMPAFYRLARKAGVGAAALRFAQAAGADAGAEQFCRDCHDAESVDEAVRAAGLDPDSRLFGVVRLRNGAPASAHLVKCLLLPYLSRDFRPRTPDPEMSRQNIDSESQQLEKSVDMASLQAALDGLFPARELYANPRWFSAYCRFASSQQISEYDRHVRVFCAENELVRRHACTALVLNDTYEAMCRAAEYECGGRFRTLLGYWCHIRGRKPVPVIDGAMQVHLEPDGIRRYDFGGRELEVRLEDGLTLQVWDSQRGEPVLGQPAWGLGQQDAAVLAADLKEMEGHLRSFLETEGAALRHLYAFGHSLSARAWERLYLRDPVRKIFARNLIWTQGKGLSFRVTGDGLRSWDDRKIMLDPRRPVRLAHLIEMKSHERSGWQDRPEEAVLDQLGERLRCGEVPPDYYNGLSITVRDKQEFERYFGRSGNDWKRLSVDDDDRTFVISCRCAPQTVESLAADGEMRLGSFCLTKGSRTANIALNLLDDMTIRSRIRQDDPAALTLIEHAGCTRRQLRTYLDLAMEAEARHLTPALLELQRPHVVGTDGLYLS